MESRLIDIYHNSPDTESLCTALIYDLKCDFLLIGWFVTENIWYIPFIYDKNISELPDTNNTKGWYLNESINQYNIPIRHSILKNVKTFYFNGSTKNTQTTLLYNSNVQIQDTYLFIVESFINRLIVDDIIKRNHKKQDTITNNISRFVRTSLSEVLYSTNLLANQQNQINQDSQLAIKSLNQSTMSLATGILDIVDMLKLENNKLKMEAHLFNLHELLESVVGIANKLNNNSNVVIEYYVENAVPENIYTDYNRLKQILISLLENSIQHTNVGEIILYVTSNMINLSNEDGKNTINSLYAMDHQHNLSFSIRDTGMGMNESIKNMLFKPLEILDSDIGMSLRISYLLAKNLNGILKLVYSEPGKGSCFKLEMVVCDDEPPELEDDIIKILKGKQVLIFNQIPNWTLKILDKYKIIYTIASSCEEITLLHSREKYNLILCNSVEDVDKIKNVMDSCQILDINTITEATCKKELVNILKDG